MPADLDLDAIEVRAWATALPCCDLATRGHRDGCDERPRLSEAWRTALALVARMRELEATWRHMVVHVFDPNTPDEWIANEARRAFDDDGTALREWSGLIAERDAATERADRAEREAARLRGVVEAVRRDVPDYLPPLIAEAVPVVRECAQEIAFGLLRASQTLNAAGASELVRAADEASEAAFAARVLASMAERPDGEGASSVHLTVEKSEGGGWRALLDTPIRACGPTRRGALAYLRDRLLATAALVDEQVAREGGGR